MDWISVKDKLPELDQDVLLYDDWQTDKKGDMRVGHLSEYTTRKTSSGIDHFCDWGGTEFAFNITHWMPLPEPPKQEES